MIRRQTPHKRRRSIPYAFELTVLIVIAAIGAATIAFFGGSLGNLWKKVAAPWHFVPLQDVYPDAMDLAAGPDGKVWLLTKYGITRFNPGMESEAEKLLDPARYRTLFGAKMNALSTLRVTGNNEAWIGSWYGELFHYQNGRWRQLTRRGGTLSGRIRAMSSHSGAIYVGGREGLWRWIEAAGMLRHVDDAPPGEINGLETDAAGRLLAAVGNTLWRWDRGRWKPIWQGAPEDGNINLHDALDGGWLLGTGDGLVRLESTGQVAGRLMPGFTVTSAVERGDSMWAATWGQGLIARIGETVVPVTLSLEGRDKNLTDILIDKEGVLWVTIYGKGASRAKVSELSSLLRDDAE